MKKSIFMVFAAFACAAPREFDDDEDASLLHRNNAAVDDIGADESRGIEVDEKATSFKQVTMMARLLNSKDGWQERGVISLGYTN